MPVPPCQAIPHQNIEDKNSEEIFKKKPSDKFDDMGVFFYTGQAIDSKTERLSTLETFSRACSYP